MFNFTLVKVKTQKLTRNHLSICQIPGTIKKVLHS